jgi:hypothetical protein
MPTPRNTSANTTPSGSTPREARWWIARMTRAAMPSDDAASTMFARRKTISDEERDM